jgi:hypothetical protein
LRLRSSTCRPCRRSSGRMPCTYASWLFSHSSHPWCGAPTSSGARPGEVERRPGRATKPLETRNRWIVKIRPLRESQYQAHSQPRSCLTRYLWQRPPMPARIREIRLLD